MQILTRRSVLSAAAGIVLAWGFTAGVFIAVSRVPALPVFACTRIVGFSQTRQWFDAGFQSLAGDGAWEIYQAHGSIDQWASPSFAGWSSAIISPCQAGPPDRLLITVTGSTRTDWPSQITAAVTTARTKVPTAVAFWLQPVVGGPGHALCYYQGAPIRATINHPAIDAAIAGLVGGDIAAGASPEVAQCAHYSDRTGHLTSEGASYVSGVLGTYYAP